jgi:hypothetical protein
MTLPEFFQQNLWGILVGAAGLGIMVLTVRLTLAQLTIDVSKLCARIDDHGGRINKLEVSQAHRLGYEQAKAELKG